MSRDRRYPNVEEINDGRRDISNRNEIDLRDISARRGDNVITERFYEQPSRQNIIADRLMIFNSNDVLNNYQTIHQNPIAR
jgi:hypothetical protein